MVVAMGDRELLGHKLREEWFRGHTAFERVHGTLKRSF